MQIRRIACALAASGDEQHLIRTAQTMAAAHAASLALVHVVGTTLAVTGYALSEMIEVGSADDPCPTPRALRGYAERMLGSDLADGVLCDVRNGDPIEDLAALSREVDLMVIGHHYHNLIERLFGRSFDERLINRAACPILIAPDPA